MRQRVFRFCAGTTTNSSRLPWSPFAPITCGINAYSRCWNAKVCAGAARKCHMAYWNHIIALLTAVGISSQPVEYSCPKRTDRRYFDEFLLSLFRTWIFSVEQFSFSLHLSQKSSALETDVAGWVEPVFSNPFQGIGGCYPLQNKIFYSSSFVEEDSFQRLAIWVLVTRWNHVRLFG